MTADRPASKLRITDISLIGIMSALICVCSWITVPFTVPFTMQTFAMFVTLLLLPDVRGLISISVYVLLGAVGLPVFSGFTGGVDRLLGPTGGYITGFLLMAVIYLIILKIFGSGEKIKIIGLSVGLLVCYAAGTLWFAHFTHKLDPEGILSSLILCVLPFIIPDIVKLLAAVFICRRVGKFINRRGS